MTPAVPTRLPCSAMPGAAMPGAAMPVPARTRAAAPAGGGRSCAGMAADDRARGGVTGRHGLRRGAA